jgi:hypothetical protein
MFDSGHAVLMLKLKWSKPTSWKTANTQRLHESIHKSSLSSYSNAIFFKKSIFPLRGLINSTLVQRLVEEIMMIKAWDTSKTLHLQICENKPLGTILKIGSFWWNEAVWINETNSFYLNHLWCEMGSHTEESLETSDRSTLEAGVWGER